MGHLAWPIVAVVIVYILRAPLERVIGKRIKSLTLPGGISAEFFDQGVERARAELASEATVGEIEDQDVQESESPSSDFFEVVRQLAEVSPGAAVIEAFRRLEVVIRDELEPSPNSRPTPLLSLVKRAVDEKRLSPAEASAFNELRRLRNVLVHQDGQDIDSESALAFSEVAYRLAISLRLSSGKTINDGAPI